MDFVQIAGRTVPVTRCTPRDYIREIKIKTWSLLLVIAACMFQLPVQALTADITQNTDTDCILIFCLDLFDFLIK